jgi:sterol desaturase/sphingolipid hydroxylase (fatty acid hydroxylase superfamily)
MKHNSAMTDETNTTHERIPRARSFAQVTRGFLQCPEARITTLALAGLWLAAAFGGSRHGAVPLVVLAGFMLWYLIEIPIHRYILHAQPRHPALRKLMYRLHHAHHERPTDPALLFLPEWVSLPSIAIVLGVAAALGLFPDGLWFMAGFWTALTTYEWMHYGVHSRWRPDWGPMRRTFADHLRHHFLNEGYWFGVSNRFMDRFWGTSPDPQGVEKSESTRDLTAGERNSAL